jgi:hypothetical protein
MLLKYWKLTYYLFQEAAKQHEITIKKMETDLQEERVTRDSIIRVHSDENQVAKMPKEVCCLCLIMAYHKTAGTKCKDGIP